MNVLLHPTAKPAFTISVIPEGRYSIRFVECSQKPLIMFGRPRIFAAFQIADGEYAGTCLQAFYSVARGHQNGEYTVPKGISAHLRRDTVSVLGYATTDLQKFEGLDLIGKVTTVTTDSEGDVNVPELHYSKITKIRRNTHDI